ncbi:WD40 repeat-like protein [Rhizopogon vinicolor AM-OR11-026]|uniref:WD40 repeat-like protein n=1 Tax=Rhizopogon vinicolor AM-OR11-026 TaxID=1314800 RepID=A0A1B7MN48_9AGAM|nr:WD40 repeat-like protein [Rhizopogon vinicolor AM-OR11-026]
MASTSRQSAPAAKDMKLTPVITLEGHKDNHVRSISYFPDGNQMISASGNNAVRRWDLQAGKEIEKRKVCKYEMGAVAVSGDSRWVVTAGGDRLHGELKAWEVETGIIKTFHGHSENIICIDISADCTLLASGSLDQTARIWSLDTGKPVAGPFKATGMGAIRFSPDSKKLAVNSWQADCLEVLDIQTQKLDRRVKGKKEGNFPWSTHAPVFWTNKGTRILAVFDFDDSFATTFYEFDSSTLETVGTPFRGHTSVIKCLALSSDGTLIASAAGDGVRLWAFESRQLLALFQVTTANDVVVFSPDTQHLAYANYTNVYICNIPPNILATIGLATKGHPKKTAVSYFPAPITFKTRLANWWSAHAGHAAPPIVNVLIAPGKQRNAAAGAPKQQDEELVRDEYCDDDLPLKNPNSQQSTAAALANAGDHGSDQFCFCF